MTITQLKKFFYTVRYLKIKQFFYQLYYRFSKISAKSIVSRDPQLRIWQKAWFAPLSPIPILSTTGELSILGEQITIDDPQLWHNVHRSRLWLYTIHYFDVLNAVNADLYPELLHRFYQRWIDENPPCTMPGWEPYPLSLRLVNVIKWFSRRKEEIPAQWLINIGMQADALVQQIEYHILANHLLVNGKALTFCGAYFSDSRAQVYLQKGLNILDQELEVQFLQDGGHFELSPMYHCIILWDLCDLVHLAHCSGLPELQKRLSRWRQLIEKALCWLESMSHPDGAISFFNDAALGVGPKIADLNAYAQQLNLDMPQQPIINLPPETPQDLSVNWLKDSGYCVVTRGHTMKAILDVAPVGPDYQPGHAHADTLSFELSLFGQRILVNSGTSTYAEGPQRQYERSTKAHNTLRINNEDSSEVWAAFRVARRAYPQQIQVQQLSDAVHISGSHDGYTRLPGRPAHHRTWSFSQNELRVSDAIKGDFEQGEMRLYFHPQVQVTLEHDLITCQLSTGQTVYITLSGARQIELETSAWYPYFGVALPNTCLIARLVGRELVTRIQWED